MIALPFEIHFHYLANQIIPRQIITRIPILDFLSLRLCWSLHPEHHSQLFFNTLLRKSPHHYWTRVSQRKSRCIMSIRRLPNWWKCDNIDVSQTWFMKISVHFAKLKLKQPRTIKLTNNKCWETVLTSTTGHQTLVPERLMRHGCSTSRVFSSCSCGNKGWGQGKTARCCSNFQFSRDTLTLTKLREFFFENLEFLVDRIFVNQWWKQMDLIHSRQRVIIDYNFRHFQKWSLCNF